MHLPQELVDYVIDFLHDDSRTLIQASLVSRAWLGRARSHLCERLDVTRPKLLSSNPSHLPPLCRYVKTLHLTWLKGAADLSAILDCFERSEPHTLALHSCELRDLGEQTIRQYFAKFPCASITTLELHEISPTRRTLLVLLSLFPNVDNLMISPNRWWEYGPGDDDADGIFQHISPPRFGGSFKFLDPPRLRGWSFDRGKILSTLASLPLRFQTVLLNVDEQPAKEISTFLNSCSQTVRKMFVGLPYRKSRPCIPQSRVLSARMYSEPNDQLDTHFRFRESRGITYLCMERRSIPSPPTLAIGHIAMSSTGDS
jgi:hypothetical protein